MSHEFRTPLNAILGFAQLLEGEDLTPDQQEDLRHIHKAGDQLLHLLTEALDLSRLEGGRVRMTIEDVPLASIAAAATRGSAVTADVEPVVRVLADARQLENVLTELATNALRHGGPDVNVHIEAAASGDTVEIRVVDDGRGVDPDRMDAVFAPFERGDGDDAGLGLGLSLARRTVQAMGGTLHAEAAPGGGAVMRLTLPSGRSGAGGDRTGARILYVDDGVSNLRLVEKVLARDPGMSLHVATTGREGIAAATEELPDLVLLELDLPDVPGAEVIEALRSDPRTAPVPVLVLTTDHDPAVAGALRDIGVADVLTKPFDPEVLADTVMSLLDAKAVR